MQAAESRVDAIRRFNRFYTRHFGLLREHLLESKFSLTEARILYELAHGTNLTSTQLCRELGLNAGYVSRVVSGFVKKGLVSRKRSKSDARASHLELTRKGRSEFATLNDASRTELAAMLAKLPEPAQHRLVEAVAAVQGVLAQPSMGYLLRDAQPGDMGWIVHRQAVLYSQEFGWNSEYEALVAEIVARFVRNYDPSCEHCWIAEKDGTVIGSVFVVREDAQTAKLRLLYVDPLARGLGIGTRLVDEALRFARRTGYRKMMLWTNSVLASARRIYERAGFQLIREEPHHSFGKDLVGQFWSRDL